MEVNTTMAPTDLQTSISVEVMKKSQEVVKNEVSKILEDTFENTMKIQQEAAMTLGNGINLDIKG
jgi:hypothetical protein